ncbi:MAG: EscU/YscU/HrcU family type III secretion system export apparatus switch protein [Vicinamibacterales bacterium]
MSTERKEHPTGKRLQDARRDGQVARSRDLTQAIQLAAVLMAFTYYGPQLVAGLAAVLQEGLRSYAGWGARSLTVDDLTPLLITRTTEYGLLVGPLALWSALVVVAAASAQGGWIWAPRALKLHWGSLSPANGLKKLVPSRAFIEVGKTVLVASVVAWICWGLVNEIAERAEPLSRMAPIAAAEVGWDVILRMLKRCSIFLVLLAGGDYGYQKYRYIEGLRMTKQEVKDEHRLMEGNPETKARVRKIQRQIARRRMLAAVPQATVVITNPTHFAVALEYRREAMAAPLVVAKGQDHLAERIKAIAREHGVPLVENKPLAQALFRTVEVGDSIPAELFEAVAEVLAYLIRLKQLAI